MDNQKIKNLIDKYLAGKATAAEIFVVESWMESLQSESDEISEQKIKNDSKALADKILAETLRHDVDGVSETNHHPLRLWRNITKVAVLLIVFSLCALVYFKTDHLQNKSLPTTGYDRYYTAAGELKRLVLPDSTIVYLNANSVLDIERDFTRHSERRVVLNGEAFFEVKKDKACPFTIQVAGLRVKVLGTSFNISAHDKLEQVKVSVKTGRVQINKERKQLATLSADQELVFNKVKNTVLTFDSTEGAKALWRDDVFVLDNASFEELDVVMFNLYGVELKTTDRRLLKQTYNFTVRRSRSMEQSLGQLCEMMDKKYRKEGRSIIIF